MIQRDMFPTIVRTAVLGAIGLIAAVLVPVSCSGGPDPAHRTAARAAARTQAARRVLDKAASPVLVNPGAVIAARAARAKTAKARKAAARRAAEIKAARHVTWLCGRDQHMISRTGIDIRNNNFRHEPECLANRGGAPGFVVAGSGAHTKDAAFPNTFAGCETSVCSPRSGMPARVRDIRSLTSTWHYAPAHRWKGDATYDIWFDPRPRTRGQDTGAEIMIWTDTRGLGRPAGHAVKIDGAQWRYSWHRAANKHGQSWNYLLFWKASPSDRIDSLPLKSFVTFAEWRRLVLPRWYLTGVEAGFELWSGGTGARTEDYTVSLASR